MPSIPALVEPELLKWARGQANLEPIAADRKIGVPDGSVERWERGETQPTIVQLRKAAKVYMRALAVFFMSEPPQGFNTLRDFRRIAEQGDAAWSTALHAEYRRAHVQRDFLLELAELDGLEPADRWRLSMPGDDERLAEAARQHVRQMAALPFPTPGADEYKHLGYWTNALEESGVLVMSTEGGEVSVDEMRAFSLYFDQVPVIMLNGADATRGRLFSLLHEYVHLLLHTEGLCDTRTDNRATSPNRQLEARCNAVAAAILMPRRAVLSSRLVTEHAAGDVWSLGDLIDAAKPFGVSVEAFLRRLVTLGRVSMETYQEFRSSHGQEDGTAAKRKARGGNFYTTKARDLGKGYVRRVSSAHRHALIDSAAAASYLDVKVDQIPKLARAAQVAT
jgi:Zn-dependent peptidase ImmA (M78 family)